MISHESPHERYPWILQRVLIPAASAFLTWAIIHISIQELLRPPYSEMLIHPVAEGMVELIVAACYGAMTRFDIVSVTLVVVAAVLVLLLLCLPAYLIGVAFIYALLATMSWGGGILGLNKQLAALQEIEKWEAWKQEQQRKEFTRNPPECFGVSFDELYENDEGESMFPHPRLDDDERELHARALAGGIAFILLCPLGIIVGAVFALERLRIGLLGSTAVAVILLAFMVALPSLLRGFRRAFVAEGNPL